MPVAYLNIESESLMIQQRRRSIHILLGGLLAVSWWGACPPAHAADPKPASSSTAPAAAKATAKPGEVTPLLKAQIWLDRLGISPGEIDGVEGDNTTRAIVEFQRRVRRRKAEGRLDWLTRRQLRRRANAPALTSYTITPEDAAGPFAAIPADPAEKAKLDRLGYTSLLEALGERFHASPELLQELNPNARFVADEALRVPNVLPSPPEPAQEADAAKSPPTLVKVIVSKSAHNMRGVNAAGETVFYAPASSGSEHDPLPIGSWKVVSVTRNPVFHYNPDLFWDAEPTQEEALLPGGPNNPVGVGWVGISKAHYGLHGTPSPGAIGHTESHGCVRLTNWDARRLMAGVEAGTPVEFVE